jgi:hypothetical protein
MIDFTTTIYGQLLQTLISKKYSFQTMQSFMQAPDEKSIVMRHDVDRRPENSLRMAKQEYELGVKATYYFRMILQTFKPEIIKEIAEFGHEIAYHYENLAETNGDYEKAIEDFEKKLSRLREIVPIKNIAMHGRPTSRWDSRLLWEKYNYKKYGILSEPYFDINFNEVLYITDAGRKWNNDDVNRRDKVKSLYGFQFKHVEYIITALQNNKLPNQIMLNIHPEHWADSSTEWWKIWVIRKVKNRIKKMILRKTKLN